MGGGAGDKVSESKLVLSHVKKKKKKNVGAFVFGLQQKSGWRNPTLQNGMNYRDIDRERG